MKFTDSHEWVTRENDDICRVGITSFAQKELGDIVYVEAPKIGKEIQAKQEVAVLESTKAAADVYSPVSGTILEVNTQLKESPELINQSPEEKGWIYTIRISNPKELDEFMDKKQYDSMISGK
jgi:glycine cleavage system H protein